jgi:hypothetical protein
MTARIDALRELAGHCRRVARMADVSPEVARALLAMAAEYDALAEIGRQRDSEGPSIEIS